MYIYILLFFLTLLVSALYGNDTISSSVAAYLVLIFSAIAILWILPASWSFFFGTCVMVGIVDIVAMFIGVGIGVFHRSRS